MSDVLLISYLGVNCWLIYCSGFPYFDHWLLGCSMIWLDSRFRSEF